MKKKKTEIVRELKEKREKKREGKKRGKKEFRVPLKEEHSCVKTFSRDRIDPGWITPSTLMNEEGVKQSFVPVFKKSGWLDGGKGGNEKERGAGNRRRN